MATRGSFGPLLTPGLHAIFFDELKVTKPVHTKWINVETSKRAWEDDYKIAGLGRMVRKDEGGVYTMDEPISGDTRRYTHITYGLGFRATEEMYDDDLYGVMQRMSRELAKAATYNKEVQAASVLNNAFDSNFTGFDGVELCSDSHPNLGNANTQANAPSTGTDFSLLALQAAIEAFETWTDDRGFIIDITPSMVAHAAENIWEVGEVLESEYVPDTADNNKNIVRSKYGISPFHYKHLTDSDSWFLLGNKSDHDAKMFMRKDTSFNDSQDPFNGDMIYTARQRLSTGFSDWRGIYGSAGA